jgi:hypothetical protein
MPGPLVTIDVIADIALKPSRRTLLIESLLGDAVVADSDICIGAGDVNGLVDMRL